MRYFFPLLSVLLVVASLWADAPANDFYVLKVSDLQALIPKGGDISRMDRKSLEKASLVRGQFTCPTRTRVVVNSTTVFVDAKRVGREVKYSISGQGKISFSCEGQMRIDPKFCANPGWQKGDYVVVFKFINLKK